MIQALKHLLNVFRSEVKEEKRRHYDIPAWPSAVLTLSSASEKKTEGKASHPAVISKQREDWRQQFSIFLEALGQSFP